VITSPLRTGSCDPFQMAFPWLMNGGLPTTCNHGMILEVGGLPGISCHLNDLTPLHLSFQSNTLETRKRDANRDGIFKWESTSFCWKPIDITLQGTNISHLGKRKIIFKSSFGTGYVSSQEGNQMVVGVSGW